MIRLRIMIFIDLKCSTWNFESQVRVIYCHQACQHMLQPIL